MATSNSDSPTVNKKTGTAGQSDQSVRIPVPFVGQLLRLLTIALGVAAAYFMTIQSIRLELAAKAESTVVETLDKKLGGLEVLLKEGVVSKEQFYQFSTQIEGHLIRIEEYLVGRDGENDGT